MVLEKQELKQTAGSLDQTNRPRQDLGRRCLLGLPMKEAGRAETHGSSRQERAAGTFQATSFCFVCWALTFSTLIFVFSLQTRRVHEPEPLSAHLLLARFPRVLYGDWHCEQTSSSCLIQTEDVKAFGSNHVYQKAKRAH